jgi:hypothetical protein
MSKKSAPFKPYPQPPSLKGLTDLEAYFALSQYSHLLDAWLSLHDVNGYRIGRK